MKVSERILGLAHPLRLAAEPISRHRFDKTPERQCENTETALSRSGKPRPLQLPEFSVRHFTSGSRL